MLGFGFTFDPVLHIEPLLTLMDSGVQCACSVVDCNNESSCFEGRWVVVLTIYAHTHTIKHSTGNRSNHSRKNAGCRMPDMHTCTCASFVCCTRHNNDFGDDMCQAKVLAAWVAKSVLWPILPAPAADSEPAWWPREREREGEREDRRARCENICALLAYGCQCDWIGPGCSSSMSLAEPCHYRYSLDPGS